MAEMDVLERRIAAALLDYVGDISDAVDASAVARGVALEHPRRRASGVGWRPTAVPRVAWVLLLLAALLVAVAGMLVVGSLQEGKLPIVAPPVGQPFACPPGSTPDEPGPADEPRPAGGARMVFDGRAGRIVGLLATGFGGTETWAFDVCANAWARMHPDREPSMLDTPQLVYDVDSDVTIAVETGKPTWAYDLEADAWLRKGVAPAAVNDRGFGATYDPVSGLVIVQVDSELWSYDVETDQWVEIARAPWSSWAALAYDASVDRIVAYTRWATWTLEVRTGTFSRSGAESPGVYSAWGMNDYAPAIQYDAGAGRTVVSDLFGRAAAYDAGDDRWEILVELDERLPFDAYDPVNGRLVVRGDDDAVLGFDLATREWTVLLQPTEGEPAPGSE